MFVKKNITFTDAVGKRVIDTTKDIVNIGSLATGMYNVTISYALTIPPSYPDEIAGLEKKYDISLTTREKYILGMYPQWATRGVVYTPKHVTISHVQGDIKSNQPFDTSFSHNVLYLMSNGTNNSMKTVNMQIEVK